MKIIHEGDIYTHFYLWKYDFTLNEIYFYSFVNGKYIKELTKTYRMFETITNKDFLKIFETIRFKIVSGTDTYGFYVSTTVNKIWHY